MARPKKATAEKADDNSYNDFSFDPGTQIDLEL